MSHWYTIEANDDERRKMLDALSKMLIDGDLTMPPVQMVPVAEWRQAIDRTMNVQGAPKQILVFDSKAQ